MSPFITSDNQVRKSYFTRHHVISIGLFRHAMMTAPYSHASVPSYPRTPVPLVPNCNGDYLSTYETLGDRSVYIKSPLETSWKCCFRTVPD